MKRQRGLTLTGLIVTAIILVLGAILAFKVVPVYLEYQTVKKIFKSMAEDPALRSARRGEIERVWAARTSIDNVTSLSGEAIEVTKEGDGIVVSADYAVKVPLMRNLSLYFEFHPTSK